MKPGIYRIRSTVDCFRSSPDADSQSIVFENEDIEKNQNVLILQKLNKFEDSTWEDFYWFKCFNNGKVGYFVSTLENLIKVNNEEH